MLCMAGCRGPAHEAPSNNAMMLDGILVPTELDPDITPVITATGAGARPYDGTPTSPARWNHELVL